MLKDTVTIYNKYLDSGVEKWQRTVLTGVYWNVVKGALTRKTGITTTDSAVIIIPHSVACNRSYKKPNEWIGLSDKAAFWTLQGGDIIVKGSITYEVQRSSKELQSLDDCLTITSVDDKDFGGRMAHWEVGGK